MNLLLVEDDEGVRTIICLLFQMRWPDVCLIATHSGKTALNLIEKEDLSVVILDLGLPDIHGFDVLKQIRRYSTIPVIILTARKEQSYIDEGFALGADDYIVKPFKNTELLERVKNLTLRYVPENARYCV